MKLTVKQKEFINNANRTWNFKIGATRSGKTWLDFNYRIAERTRTLSGLEGLYVIMGVTNSTIERNVLEPMRQLYGDSLVGFIQPGKSQVNLFGETYHVIGAEKINAMNKIQGMSIKYCYGDEIVRWNKEVFEMLKSRLDKEYSTFDGTGNPEQPSHFIKEFIDKSNDMFYQGYTIDDNPMLPPDFVRRLKEEYLGTVYYDRYILGKWAMAEGQIYKPFNQDNIVSHAAWHEIDENGNYVHELRKRVMYVVVGVDFGGSGSATAFNATAYTKNFKQIVTVKEKRITKELDPTELDMLFIEFIKEVELEYRILNIRADSAEQILIRGMRKALQKHKMIYQIKNAIKGVINDRIRFYVRMMNMNRYYCLDSCKETKIAFETAVWKADQQDDERLDDGTTNIDNLDAQEYSTEEFHNLLIKIE